MGKVSLTVQTDLLIFIYVNGFVLLGTIVTVLEISLHDTPALEQSSKTKSTQIRCLTGLLLSTTAFDAFMHVQKSVNWNFFSFFKGLFIQTECFQQLCFK